MESPVPDQTAVEKANASFEEVRRLFKAGDYAGAERQVEDALKNVPNDLDLHEFPLTLFGKAHHSEAAAALYTVLSARPGWNWATLIDLYPSVDVFTAQLASLSNTALIMNAASGRFVLGYLYLDDGFDRRRGGRFPTGGPHATLRPVVASTGRGAFGLAATAAAATAAPSGAAGTSAAAESSSSAPSVTSLVPGRRRAPG